MKIKIIESKFITFWILGVAGIVLYPFLFINNKNNKKLLNHELIHVEQIKDCGVLMFYILYLWYWIKNGFSYLKNPFEIEAFDNENDMEYISNRERKKWRF
jgi:hypothetical protein